MQPDLAYLAGYLDGDGSIGLERRSLCRGHQCLTLRPVVAASSVDRRILDRIRYTWGGSICSRPGRGRQRPYAAWVVTDRKAQALLQALQPYLVLLADRAVKALAYRDVVVQKPVVLTEQEQLAYLAGFIDADGWITLSHERSAVWRPCLGASNTDNRIPELLLARFGGCVTFRHWQANSRATKDAYQWTCGSRRAVEALSLLLPYLFLKADRAQLVLQFWALGQQETVPRTQLAESVRLLNQRGIPIQEEHLT